MVKKAFEPVVEGDLNRPYNVTLTEGEIGTILHHLEIVSSKYGTSDEIERIFEELEGAVDNYYSKVEAAQKKQPIPEWEEA